MNEYEEQANNFLKKTGTEFKTKFLKNDLYFPDDKEPRDIYEITLTRGERVYTFKFGQSVSDSGKFIIWGATGKFLSNDEKEAKKHRGKGHNVTKNKDFTKPSTYCILAGLTSYNPDTFEDFCSSYGYEEDSRKAEKIYNAVVKEWENVRILWSDEEIKLLQEIN